MAHLEKVLKNSTYLVVSQNIARGITLLQVLLLTRVLGERDYGIYSVAQAFPTILFVLTDFGLNSIFVRQVARDRSCAADRISEVLFIKSLLAVLYISALSVLCWFSNYPAETKKLLLFSGLCYIPTVFSEVVIAMYRATEKFYFECFLNVFKVVLFLLLVCGCFLLNFGLVGVIVSGGIANLVSTIISIWSCRKQVPLKFTIQGASVIVAKLKQSMPFAAHNVISPLFSQMDVLMLSKYSTEGAVGVYNAAYRVVVVMQALPEAVNRALFPRMSALHAESLDLFKQQLAQGMKLLSVGGIAVALGIYGTADGIVHLLFPPSYAEGSSTLKIQALSLITYFPRLALSAALYASHLERFAITSFAIGTFCSWLMSFLLIPRLGAVGAAISSFTAELVLFSLYYFGAQKYIGKFSLGVSLPRLLAPGAGMLACVTLASSLPLILQVIIGAISYFTLVAAFKIFNPEETLLFKNLFQKLLRRKKNNPPSP